MAVRETIEHSYGGIGVPNFFTKLITELRIFSNSFRRPCTCKSSSERRDDCCNQFGRQNFVCPKCYGIKQNLDEGLARHCPILQDEKGHPVSEAPSSFRTAAR